jgi:hypothetical protein
MTVAISPLFNNPQYFDNDGNPLSGGKIFQYEAGSFSVQQTTYSDAAGATPNPNPIELDSSGRSPSELYLTNGVAYNLVLTMPDGTTILTYSDNVVGVQPVSAGVAGINVWNTVTENIGWVSPTQFLVATNQTLQFAIGNRARLQLTDETYRYGTVTAVSFVSPNTQVTIVNDSGTLPNDLIAAAWSTLVSWGMTVDAAGVSYVPSFTYPSSNTVGFQIQSTNANVVSQINTVNSTIIRNSQSPTAYDQGSFNYTMNLSPAVTSYTNTSLYTVTFNTNNYGAGTPTLNINGLGARLVRQYNSSGTLVTGVTGRVCTLAYNGDSATGVFIILSLLPSATTSARGWAVYSSNDTFVVPANVNTIKVTCIGGGGGGTDADFTQNYWRSGIGGGGGGTGIQYFTVSPGQSYPVIVGAGGGAGGGVGVDSQFGVGTSNFLYGGGGNQFGIPGSGGSGLGLTFQGGNGWRGPYFGGNVVNGNASTGPGPGGNSSMGPAVVAWGSGGQGGSVTNNNPNPSGPGISGLVIVEW